MNYDVYDAKDWAVEIAGVTITGLGEDAVTWEKAEANGEMKRGSQGDGIWQVTNDETYNLTVTVLANCPQLKHLISLFKKTEPFAVSAINKKLGLSFSGTQALFEEEPSFEFGVEAGDIELTICVFDGKTAYLK